MTVPVVNPTGTSMHTTPGSTDGILPAAPGTVPGAARPRRRTFKAHVVVLVVISVVVTAAGAAFVRRASINNARESTASEAEFSAGLAARAISGDAQLILKTVAATAASPGIVQVFAKPQACTLVFGAGDVFASGHIDVLDSNGSLVCSSLHPGTAPAPSPAQGQQPAQAERPTQNQGYEGASWLSRALNGQVMEGPFTDPRTGQPAFVVASPISGRGIVAAFADVSSLGPTLAKHFGGPRRFEFVVTSADQRTILTRSIDPTRWSGQPTAGTDFAPNGVPPSAPRPQHGVDGTSRIYGRADVDQLNWRVWAGADMGQALAPARRLAQQEAIIVLVGAVMLLGAAFVVYRKIAAPLQRLSTAVHAESEHIVPRPVEVAGPSEVASIAENFNRLAATVGSHLDAGLRLTAIVNAVQDAIIGETVDGTVTSWNSGAELTYGYTAEEMVGRNESILVPPDRAAEQADLLGRVAAGHPVHRFETQRVRKDGTIIDVAITVSPVRDAGGAVVGAAVVSRDVTRALEAITEMRSSEARKSAVLQSALDCIITIDSAGKVVEFNPAAERTFGYSSDEAIGRLLSELIIPPAMRDAHTAGLARYVAEEIGPILGQRLELTAQRRDGTEFPAEVAITRVDVEGPPLFTGYLRDLTEAKRTEASREALERRLEQSQRMESLGQLAGGVAHDFNNLLAVIMNYADFVAEDTLDKPAVHADALEIRAAAERAAALTRQLLIFGRRETIQPQLLDLRAVISDLHNLLDRSIGEHVRLVVGHGESEVLPAVLADRGQIEQVLVNLAVNARDAMPRGGTLTIETDVVMLDEGHAQVRPSVEAGCYVQLSVSDTGVGMSPEVARRVFEPFFTTKPKGQGTGLGLATVYGIISGAGGTVSVYSEEGIGTTLRVYLPAAAGKAADRVGPSKDHPVQGHGETILVVEDEVPMREVTTRILRRNGYQVLEAATGPEAVTLAASQPCALLLTDVVMPVMSGREVAGAIARHRPNLPVLYMSGYSQGVLGPQQALDEGVALIQKPFNERALLAKVRAALEAEHSGVSQSGGVR